MYRHLSVLCYRLSSRWQGSAGEALSQHNVSESQQLLEESTLHSYVVPVRLNWVIIVMLQKKKQ